LLERIPDPVIPLISGPNTLKRGAPSKLDLQEVASGECQHQQVKGINVLMKILLSLHQQSASVGEEVNPAFQAHIKKAIMVAQALRESIIPETAPLIGKRRKQSLEGQYNSTTPTMLNKEINTPKSWRKEPGATSAQQ